MDFTRPKVIRLKSRSNRNAPPLNAVIGDGKSLAKYSTVDLGERESDNDNEML